MFFGLTALVAAWLTLAVSKFQEGRALDTNTRRVMMLMTGAVIGAAAFWLDETLMIDMGAVSTNQAWFDNIGKHQLMSGYQPTLAGYMTFFACLFGFRRWWWHADSFRSSRFRVSRALVTMGLAFLLTTVVAFPSNWALLWSVTISSVVQLSAVWTPFADRPQVMEASPNV